MHDLIVKVLTSLQRRGFWQTLGRAVTALRVRIDHRSERAASRRYSDWIRRFDNSSDAGRQNANRRVFEFQPLISVLLPVYNPPKVYLENALDSVLRQSYPRWELCVADDASTESYVRSVLELYAAKDSRIKVVYREQNGHISAASNSALALAAGDFVALLDHDDQLHESALDSVVAKLDAHPDADLIYSDEDAIDAKGRRSSPHFKSDWNPDLFLSQNFINHLSVYRTRIVRELGGFREGFEGSQDYDLALRVIENVPSSHVRHIPRVLYHWRAIPGSVSLGAGQKNYATAAAQLALASHLERTGRKGEVMAQGNHTYRIKYCLPAELPKVNIIISAGAANESFGDQLQKLISNTRYSAFDVSVLSQGSDIENVSGSQVIDSVSLRNIKSSELRAAAHALNDAARRADGEILLFLDAAFFPVNEDWLCEMVRHAQRPEVGAVGAKLLDLQGRILHTGLLLGVDESESPIAASAFSGLKETDPQALQFRRSQLVQNFSAVGKSCLMIRRDLFEQLQGFDEIHTPHHFYDIDLCLRVNEIGFRVLFTPYAALRLISGKSEPAIQSDPAEIDYISRRWGSRLRNDPYYNPNLDLAQGRYELAYMG